MMEYAKLFYSQLLVKKYVDNFFWVKLVNDIVVSKFAAGGL